MDLSEALQLQETIELCTEGGAGWVYISGWDVKTLRMVKAASLSFLLLRRMFTLCLHICKYKICSVLWLEKTGWEFCQVNYLSLTGAPERSTEGCSHNADSSAVGNRPVCWPVLWGNFAAFQGLIYYGETEEASLALRLLKPAAFSCRHQMLSNYWRDLASIKYDTHSSGVMVKGIRAHLEYFQPCWPTSVGFWFLRAWFALWCLNIAEMSWDTLDWGGGTSLPTGWWSW